MTLVKCSMAQRLLTYSDKGSEQENSSRRYLFATKDQAFYLVLAARPRSYSNVDASTSNRGFETTTEVHLICREDSSSS